MNNHLLIAALAATTLLAFTACSQAPQSNVGLVDVPRVTSNWPKFLNYQNQLSADAATIQRSHSSDADKARELSELNARFQQSQTELTNDVRDAAQQVASDKHLTFVLTRQYVGYGGIDITADVEKILKITERATPAP
jgi:Skp family chaperone for outer membrane proteins